MASKGLTAEQIDEIRALLLERKRTIEKDIKRDFSRSLEDTAEETTVVGVNEGKESRVDVGREMRYQVMSQRSRELKQIRQALVRIETGGYGICDECGSRIRFERLKAMPFAQLCRNCQHASEQKERDRQTSPRGPYRL